MEKDFRAEIGALVQDRKQAYTDMSDRIWGNGSQNQNFRMTCGNI